MFLGVEYLFVQELFPLYAGLTYDADPSYQYLLNSLMLLNAQSPSHTDHPGTTVQILMALVVGAKYSFGVLTNEGYSEDIFYSVLSDPEGYLVTIASVLILLNTWSMFFLGKRIYQTTHNLRLSTLSQFTPFLFINTLPSVAYPGPESVLLIVTTCLLALLAPIIFKCRGGAAPKINAVQVGIVCGVGLATKLTFAPLLILISLLRYRAALIAIVSTALAFFFLVAPLWPKLEKLLSWGLSLLTRNGSYGGGDPIGLFMIDGLFKKIQFLFSQLPLLYILIVLVVLFFITCFKNYKFLQLFIASRKYCSTTSESPNNNKSQLLDYMPVWICLVTITIISLQILIVAKHPGPSVASPLRYMLPIFPLLVVSIAGVLFHTGIASRGREFKLAVFSLFQLATVAMAIVVTTRSYTYLSDNRIIQAEALEAVQTEISKFINPIVIGTYDCILPNCAVSYGVSASEGLAGKLRELLSDHHDFNIWNSLLNSKNAVWLPLSFVKSAIDQGRTVLLSSRSNYPELEGFWADILVNRPTQTLYKIRGLAVPVNKAVMFNSDALNFDGWSFSETSFRWSLGKYSAISFYLNASNSTLKPQHPSMLQLEFNTLGPQALSVSLNNQKIFDSDVEGVGLVHNIVLPIGLLREGKNTLSFSTPAAKAPNANDQRELAIAFKSMSLSPQWYR